MIPILTSTSMREADARAVALRGVDALVHDAGVAVALEAKRLLGSLYARRVAVLVGPGLNGDDGRVAAAWLIGRGAKVSVFELERAPERLRGFDLVIDAAFGLGCSRPFIAPSVSVETLVLAIDLPSGVDPDTGTVLGEPMHADVTVALGAIKPALVTGESSTYVGRLRFAGLGIVDEARDGVMTDDDLARLIALNPRDHKWRHAVHVVAGSAHMPGAAELALRGALAGGASMLRLTNSAALATRPAALPEVVVSDSGVDPRCRAVVAGPGLGPTSLTWLRHELTNVSAPVVLDADGLDRDLIDDIAAKDGSWVLTPHDGEFVRLAGEPLPANRFDAVRTLARETGCVVLLKGPTTIIAHPDGRLRVVTSGTAALATAGTGDVLAGLIGATIARGHEPFDAAALAAHLHGRAGARLAPYASALDLVASVKAVIHEIAALTRRQN